MLRVSSFHFIKGNQATTYCLHVRYRLNQFYHLSMFRLKCSDAIDTICVTILDYYSDHKHLRSRLQVDLLTSVETRLIAEYISSIVNRYVFLVLPSQSGIRSYDPLLMTNILRGKATMGSSGRRAMLAHFLQLYCVYDARNLISL